MTEQVSPVRQRMIESGFCDAIGQGAPRVNVRARLHSPSAWLPPAVTALLPRMIEVLQPICPGTLA